MKNLFILTVSSVLFILVGCNKYGNKVNFGNLEIFYKDGVTRDQASRVGEYLVKNNFPTSDGKEKSMQILKVGDVYHVNVVVEPVKTFNADFMNTLAPIASNLSAEVFNGAEVEMHLCNEHLESYQAVKMHDWQVFIDGEYDIKYPQSWTIVHRDDNRTKFMLFPQSPENAYRNNMVTLGTEDLPAGHKNLEQYTQELVDQINDPNETKNGRLIQSTTKVVDRVAHSELIYNHADENKMERVEQRCWIIDDKLYVLSSCINLANISQSDITTSQAILNSFVIR